MELFLPGFDLIFERFESISEKMQWDLTYELHPFAWYLNALLSDHREFFSYYTL